MCPVGDYVNFFWASLFPFRLENKDSHKALVKTHKGALIVNPGSPTLPLGVPKLGTVGILEINKGKAEAHIIQLH